MDVFGILDERFLNSPTFAIEQCRSLTAKMAELSKESFLESMELLDDYSEEKASDVIAKENLIDTYDDKISAYLTRLNSGDLSLRASAVKSVPPSKKSSGTIIIPVSTFSAP